VVSFGDASVELCGGTHVDNVANIGSFFIQKESGVSAGVRRIEAICGSAALGYAQELRALVEAIKESVKHKEPLIGIHRLKEEIKTLKSDVEALNSQAGKVVESYHVNGVELIVDVLGAGDIKARIDDLKNEKEAVAVLLLQAKDDKVLIAAGVKNAPMKAGAWIKEIAPIVGGGGGGRDDFAQAGGKDASRIEEAKQAALAYAKALLQG
jgi:alanyl-tRNA synthetase